MTLPYDAFLAAKAASNPSVGVAVASTAINPMLFPFQRQLVQWALRKGRAALFCDTGLGKTFMQLEWARLLECRTLILAPLAVAQQTIAESEKLGINVVYARNQADATGGITIANYEMLDHFDPAAFEAVVLDESSILKSFDGKTRTRLIEAFAVTKYRLCCTATPAPNDLEEFGNHAEFLGVSTRSDMLATFFTHRDDGWSIKGHAVSAFYKWLAHWAMMVKRPSDIGFTDDGYDLPLLTVEPVWVGIDHEKVAQATGQLFSLGLHGIEGRSAIRKATVGEKINAAADLIEQSDEQWLVWVGLNNEGRMLSSRLNGRSALMEGEQSMDEKVAAINEFVTGDRQVLITKPRMAGFGLNFQHCRHVMFIGLSDSYEQYYQAIRRCWRFGQSRPVDVKVVISETEAPILENVMRKEQQAADTSAVMIREITAYERAELISETVTDDYQTSEASGEGWRMLLGDSAERLRKIDAESIDLSVYSPPFLSLYVYSGTPRDMGNSRGEAEFFEHYGYLVRDLLRVTKPGRLTAVHCADVPAMLSRDGYIGLKDLPGQLVRAYVEAGWQFHGRVTIDKNPQVQALRTKAKGLLFGQMEKDSTWSRPGLGDQVLVFKRPGENAVPVQPDITRQQWILWARPIWYAADYTPGTFTGGGDSTRKSGSGTPEIGIDETDTLNVAEARSDRDERHIAPLQLGTIERCIKLWSNKGETVLSPFAGIGSEGYQAVLLNRRFIGIELKPEYFTIACRNLERAETHLKQGRLL